MNLKEQNIKKELDFMDRDQILLINVLKDTKNHNEVIIVANTHLLYNLKRAEIKLGIFCELFSRFIKKFNRSNINIT